MARRIAIEMLLAAAIGALLGLLGPFGTYPMPVGARMAYWIMTVIAGHLIFRPVLVAGDWLARDTTVPGWLATCMATAVAGLPLTLLVTWVFTGFNVSRVLRFDGLPVIYGQVLLISIVVFLAFLAAFRPYERPVGASAAPGPAASCEGPGDRSESPFLSRLPAGFGALHALGSEDHYVRAYGENGNVLLLIRLRDAVGEIDRDLEGMQVHRSWWVARRAVTGARRQSRGLRLALVNGLDVPVARDRIATLKERGWI